MRITVLCVLRAAALAIALQKPLAVRIAAAEQEPFKYQLKLDRDLSLDAGAFFPPNALTPAELNAISQQTAGYESFLAALFKRAPHLFKNHVLLHGSGSLQLATAARPRVLLFGDGLVLSFHEPAHTNKRRIEIMSFDRPSSTFAFHELVFASDKAAKPSSLQQPGTCAACHGERGSPIWDAYDFWPNAYGAAISRFRSAEEANSYVEVISQVNAPGIYRYLKEARTAAPDVRLPTIEAFSLYLSNLNFLAMAAQPIWQNSAASPWKWAKYGALARCFESTNDGFESFFPQRLHAQVKERLGALLQSTATARLEYKKYLDNVYASRFPNFTPVFQINHGRLAAEVTPVARLRLLLENSGIDLGRWTMSAGINRYFLSTPSNFSLDLLTAFASVDRSSFVNIGAQFNRWINPACATLREKSRSSLAEVQFAKPRDPQTSQAPVARCVRCHSPHLPGRFAPAIPFDDTARLRAELTSRPQLLRSIKMRIGSEGTDRMPPDVPLTAKERAAFDAFLRELME